MGVKITFGQPACPWYPAPVIPELKEGCMLPTALALCRDLTDPQDWAEHVSLLTCGITVVNSKPAWRAYRADPNEFDNEWEVLLWHDPDLPVDVRRMNEAQWFLDKNLMEEYDSKLWCLQFESIWKKQPWTTFVQVTQYGDQIGPGPTIAQSALLSGMTMGKAIAALNTAYSSPNSGPGSSAKPPLDTFKGKPILGFDENGFLVTEDYIGFPKIPGGALDKVLAKAGFKQSPMSSGGEGIGPNTPFNEVMLGSMFLMNMAKKSMGLPTMTFPDGEDRPVLLAWQMLRGPGNMWNMAHSMMMPPTILKEQELTAKTPMISRQELKIAHDHHVKMFGVLPKVILTGGAVKPLWPGLDVAMHRMFVRMGLPDETIMTVSVYDNSFVGPKSFRVAGTFRMPKLGPEIIAFDEHISGYLHGE